MKKIKIERNVLTEALQPYNEVYDPNIKNAFVRVLRVEEGKEVYDYLEWSKPTKKGRYYKSERIEKFDIIRAMMWNKSTNKMSSKYYVVLDITPSELTVDDGHLNYKDAHQAMREIIDAANMMDDSSGTFSIDLSATDCIETEEGKTVKKEAELRYECKEEDCDEDTKLVIDTYFKGFSYTEYDLFTRALKDLLVGRDIEKHPLQLNKGKDYTKLSAAIIRHMLLDQAWKIKEPTAFVKKMRDFPQDKLQYICEAIKENIEFQAFEKRIIQQSRQNWGETYKDTLALEAEVLEELAYREAEESK